MPYKILAIDDDKFSLEIVTSCLEDKYQIRCLTTGVNCSAEIEDFRPDLILLDILMPDLDGYSICQQLKSSDNTAFIPIIFLSALGDAADRIEGFACGAEDYITKPFVMSELCQKIENAITNAKRQDAWTKQYQDNIASEEFSQSSIDQFYEMGALIKFQQRCSECREVQELGNEIVELCHALGLDANIQMETHKGKQYIGCRYSSFEAKLLTKASTNGKGPEARNRAIFHSERLSILIKNMPRDDSFRYGRFKEHLEMLVKSASNRLEILDLEAKEKAEKYNAIQNFENAVFYIERNLDQHNHTIKRSLESLLSESHDHLRQLDGESEHVEKLNYCIAKCINEINRIGSTGKISKIFNTFMQENP